MPRQNRFAHDPNVTIWGRKMKPFKKDTEINGQVIRGIAPSAACCVVEHFHKIVEFGLNPLDYYWDKNSVAVLKAVGLVDQSFNPIQKQKDEYLKLYGSTEQTRRKQALFNRSLHGDRHHDPLAGTGKGVKYLPDSFYLQ